MKMMIAWQYFTEVLAPSEKLTSVGWKMGEPQSGLGAVTKWKFLTLPGFEQLVQPIAYTHRS
jgi:hypothetical protein